MATKEKKINGVNSKNELIKNLPDTDYIQNPILYSQICGNFSLMQTNMMLALVASIRDRIAQSIEPGKGIVGDIIPKGESKVAFRINLSDLGVNSKQYADVYEAGKAILKLDTSYKYINEDGQVIRGVANIFSNFEMPEAPVLGNSEKMRREGYIELKMDGDIARSIFNSSNQYVEHIADIAKLCHSPRTPRMYIYLSAWRRTCTEVVLSYDAVKEYLGMLEYTKDHSRIKEGGDKCPRYALFHRDVLRPAQEELQNLAAKGKVEFFFTYEPIYRGKKTRGVNPVQLKFYLKPASEAHPIIDRKIMTMWDKFVGSVREADSKFCLTYVDCCAVSEVSGKEIFIKCPSEFVIDNWRNQWGMLEELWTAAFKNYKPRPISSL